MNTSILYLLVAATIALLFIFYKMSRIYSRGKLIEKYESFQLEKTSKGKYIDKSPTEKWSDFSQEEILTLLRMGLISKRDHDNAHLGKLILQ